MKRFVAVSVCVMVLAALGMAGCATGAKGMTDAEQISQRVEDGIAAVKAKDFKKFETFVSGEFDSGVIGNKEDLLSYLENADGMGFLDGLEVSLTDSETTVTGDTAVVDTVDVSGPFGSLTLTFTGAKEKGVWMITGVDPY
ncbi:MAG: nuclear transport factor 2 family protein [Candidatus Hydrogenedentes bacterium]|nr:nuclear transport factor 2 family protein [Candidatus Hydrogenedentota bacterium]